MENDDIAENPLSSLQYHTLLVLGTEDYAAVKHLHKATATTAAEQPYTQHQEGQHSPIYAVKVTTQGKENKHPTDVINNCGDKTDDNCLDDVKTQTIRSGTRNMSLTEPSESMKSQTKGNGVDIPLCHLNSVPSKPNKEAIALTTSSVISGRQMSRAKNSIPAEYPHVGVAATVSLEYCSSPVPLLQDPTVNKVSDTSSSASAQNSVTSVGPLEYNCVPITFPIVTPESTLSFGSHLGSSSTSWSTLASSRTPCVSSIFGEELGARASSSSLSCSSCSHRGLPPLPLYSHDTVPAPVPVAAAASSTLHHARRCRSCLSECASSCSEKTLVGSKADSARIFGSGTDSESLFQDIIDSNPVYENPSELDSEYYYKSPKGKRLKCKCVLSLCLCMSSTVVLS